jgi:hypothetical protein
MKITTNKETILLIFSISANAILEFLSFCKVFKVAHACTVILLCPIGFILDFVVFLWLTGIFFNFFLKKPVRNYAGVVS